MLSGHFIMNNITCLLFTELNFNIRLYNFLGKMVTYLMIKKKIRHIKVKQKEGREK